MKLAYSNYRLQSVITLIKKMDVNEFLKAHHQEINEIIDNLNPVEFSSHDFIERFARRFEREYIEMLYHYRDSGNAFKTVHSLIARYLSLHPSHFPIAKTIKKDSEHVFGEMDIIQWWQRI